MTPSDSPACVFPVSAAAALAWADGKLDDLDLILKAPLIPEAVFVLNLPHLATYRQIIRQILHWRRQGAVCLITRTFNPIVDDHLIKGGALPTYKERWRWKDTQYRFFVPPAAFSGWLKL